MRLIFTGDIDFEQLVAAVEIAFEGWSDGVDSPSELPEPLENQAQAERIYIADKTSVSVSYGYQTGLRRTDPAYIPFMVGNYILGGSFHSRLMTEVRKNRGLTYSIRTGHEGDIFSSGNWLLSASFGPSQLQQGMDATEAVIADWYENGVSESEVAAALETLSGSYLVNLTTTANVAGQVLSFMERGFDAEYIDAYPKRLEQITAEQVNAAILAHFDPKKCTQAIAGSLEDAQNASPPKDQRSITVRLDSPNPNWSIRIQAIYQKDEQLIAVSQLTQNDSSAAAVITTLSDSVQITDSENLPVEYYIIGKTWNWGEVPEHRYLASTAELEPLLKDAELRFNRQLAKD